MRIMEWLNAALTYKDTVQNNSVCAGSHPDVPLGSASIVLTVLGSAAGLLDTRKSLRVILCIACCSACGENTPRYA